MPNSYLLKNLAVTYQIATTIHRNLYELRLLEKTVVKATVVGVGNLSFGGSGKTLVCQTIADKLSSQGHRVGIVCRSYGAEEGPHIISDAHADPYVVGDEAAMMSSSVDGRSTIVASGKDKTLTAVQLVEKMPSLDVIIVDDAFQHHKLHQDLRILIWPKPAAALRDFRGAARHADLLLVPNGMPSPRSDLETIFFVREFLGIDVTGRWTGATLGARASCPPMGARDARAPSKEIPPSTDRLRIDGSLPASETPALGASETLTRPAQRILICAGLGPETDFFDQVRKIYPRCDLRELRLPDHADYRKAQMQSRLQRHAENCGAILTTAKDAVKLNRLALALPPIYVVGVGIKFLTNEDMLWKKVGDALNKGA